MSKKEKDTEARIKEVAQKLFQQKGFSATKTRDIADEAGINLALLNYYFRSKKKLFDLIISETFQAFFSGVINILNDENTSLEQKISLFVENYIDMLTKNPNVIHFILNTVRENPEEFIGKMNLIDKTKSSFFMGQFMEGIMKGEIPSINPVHLLLNLMSLVVFPFIATPMIITVTGIKQQDYFEMLQERKRLIPLWINAMLQIKI